MKLQFLPVAFAPPYRTVGPYLAVIAKAVADAGAEILIPHAHGTPEYFRAAQTIDLAEHKVYDALASGHLHSYAYLIETGAFFQMPQEYYARDMWGKIRLHNRCGDFDAWRIPAALQDADHVLLMSEAEAWAGIKFSKLPSALVAKHFQPAPLGEGTLRKWFESISAEERTMWSESETLAARQSFPNKRISRDMIRLVRGPQKRGPKQFSG